MIFVPLGVVWAGYQLLWYGYSMIRGPGMGFMDLLSPSRIAQAEKTIATWSVPKDRPVSTAPSYVNAIGVQPGSVYYPPNPRGGLPSVPPLGRTPPSGYS